MNIYLNIANVSTRRVPSETASAFDFALVAPA